MTGLDLVARRGADYGALRHDAKIALLREPLGRVLDVGCAERMRMRMRCVAQPILRASSSIPGQAVDVLCRGSTL